MSSGDDDATLMQRHVEGDADAFGELVRRHRDRLWAVALRTLGDPEEAADALQDALVNAFRRAGTFRGGVGRDHMAAPHRRQRLPRPGPAGGGPARAAGRRSRAASAGRRPGGAAASRLDVEAALETLPEEQRAALVLVDMQGYPVSEVAEMLGVPGRHHQEPLRPRPGPPAPLLATAESRNPQRGKPSPGDPQRGNPYVPGPERGNTEHPADVPSTPARGRR